MRTLTRVNSKGGTKRIKLKERLAGGGAANIYKIHYGRQSVAKIYHDHVNSQELEHKIDAMLRSPPALAPVDHQGTKIVQAAWPTGKLMDGQRFVGFVMPEVDFDLSTTLESLLQRRQRQRKGLREELIYRICVAFNLANLMQVLHGKGHHIVDLKPVNLQVYKKIGFISLLDCDGISVNGRDARYPAHMITPEYLAPEAHGKRPEELGEPQDRFAMAVIIFQLLNNGIHPFQFRATSSYQGQTIAQNIKGERYVYGDAGGSRWGAPTPSSIHHSFSDEMLESFKEAFEGRDRPNAAHWASLFEKILDPQGGAKPCPNDPNHVDFGKGCAYCSKKPTYSHVKPATNRTRAPKVHGRASGQTVSGASGHATQTGLIGLPQTATKDIADSFFCPGWLAYVGVVVCVLISMLES